MTASKPEVQGWRVTRLSGNGYGRDRTIVDSEIYNAEDPAFWFPGAMELHSIEPLIRLADHERLQAETERLQAECALLRAAIRRLCNIYVVDDYYDGQLREERLEAAVNRAIDAALSQQGKE